MKRKDERFFEYVEKIICQIVSAEIISTHRNAETLSRMKRKRIVSLIMKTKKSFKFNIDGFKARQFGLVQDAKNEYASYYVKVKINRPVRQLQKSVSYYSRNTVPMNNLEDFYYEHLERRCSHSFDCCGCWFTGLSDVKRKGNEVTFKIRASRNF